MFGLIRNLFIGVQLQDEFSDPLVKANQEVTNFKNDVVKSFETVGKSINDAAKELAGWGIALSAAGAGGLYYLTSGLGMADQFTQSMKVFRQYAGEGADELYRQMTTMADGTIDNLTLLQNANRAIVMGVKTEYLPEMIRISRAAALALGQDANFMFESIAVGTARQSKLILDNLGILLRNQDQVYENYAKSIGKASAAALTEAERTIAFQEAVIAAGLDMANRVDLTAESITMTYNRAKNAAKDFQMSVSRGAMKVFQPIAEVAANALIFAKLLPEPLLALIGILGSLASIGLTVAGTFMLQAAAGIYFIKSIRESVIIPPLLARVRLAISATTLSLQRLGQQSTISLAKNAVSSVTTFARTTIANLSAVRLTALTTGGGIASMGLTGIPALTGLTGAFGGATAGATAFGGALLSALLPVLPIIAALVAAGLLLEHAWTHNFLGIQDAVAKVVEYGQTFFGWIVEGAKIFGGAIFEPIMEGLRPILETIGLVNAAGEDSKILLTIVEGLGALFKWFYGILEPFVPAIKNIIILIGKVIGTMLSIPFRLIHRGMEELIKLAEWLAPPIIAFAQAFADGIGRIIGLIKDFLGNPYVKSFLDMIGYIAHSFGGIAGGLVEGKDIRVIAMEQQERSRTTAQTIRANFNDAVVSTPSGGNVDVGKVEVKVDMSGMTVDSEERVKEIQKVMERESGYALANKLGKVFRTELSSYGY